MEVAVPPWAIEMIPLIRLLPTEVVALTTPCALVYKSPFGMPEITRLVVEAVAKNPSPLAVKLVEDAFAKMFLPLKVLLSLRSVLLAALIVMFADPSKETPLIVLAVCNAVAVPALPPIESDVAVPVSPVPAPEKELAKMVPDAERLVVEAPPLKVWSDE